MPVRTLLLTLAVAVPVLAGGATAASAAPRLLVSATPDRADAEPLAGATLGGTRYVFAAEVTGSVHFHLDGAPVVLERKAPYDFRATATDGRAKPWDTTTTADGTHTIQARAGSSTGAGPSATFAVRNATQPAKNVLTRSGDRLLLNGAPFDVWGIRVASATQDQAQTDHLIAQLDDYEAHGVNTVVVFYQGSSGAAYGAFGADGTIDAGHRSRMEQIVEAADARGMVVVAGLFYQSAPSLPTAAAYRNAARAVASALRPWRNVMLYIANESNSAGWDDSAGTFAMRPPENVLSLMEEVRAVDPARLVGGGGYDASTNGIFGRDPRSSVLFMNTVGWQRDQEREYDDLVASGVRDKPIVNAEQFGGWNVMRGVFSDDEKAEYQREIESAHRLPGLGTTFHAKSWTQQEPMRYDLAGQGTAADPGIRWYFDAVRAARAG